MNGGQMSKRFYYYTPGWDGRIRDYHDGFGIAEDPEGTYVLFSDYEKVVAERDELAREGQKYRTFLRDGFRFREGAVDGLERVAYYWCGEGGDPNGWTVRDGLYVGLVAERDELKKRCERLEAALERLAGPMDRETNIYTVQDIARAALFPLEGESK